MKNAKTLTVRIATYYGRETIYPECSISVTFARLLRQKTLTREDIEVIKELGYEVVTKVLEGKQL